MGACGNLRWLRRVRLCRSRCPAASCRPIRRSKVARRSASHRRASQAHVDPARRVEPARSAAASACRRQRGVSIAASTSRARLLRANSGGLHPGLQGQRRAQPDVDARQRRRTSTRCASTSRRACDTTIHLDVHRRRHHVDSCTLDVTSNNLNGDFDIALGIKPADGELDIHLAQHQLVHARTSTSAGCGIARRHRQPRRRPHRRDPRTVRQASCSRPLIDTAHPGLLPNPLGIAGHDRRRRAARGRLARHRRLRWRRASSRAATSTSTQRRHEPRRDHRPQRRRGSDDRARRRPRRASRALCVPPLPAPQFGAPPASLPRSASAATTFALDAGRTVRRQPGARHADLAMGISETTLDLAGHHARHVAARCASASARATSSSSTSARSASSCRRSPSCTSDNGNDPLLLVTRPQQRARLHDRRQHGDVAGADDRHLSTSRSTSTRSSTSATSARSRST